MMFSSLRFRLWLTYALVAAVIACVLGISMVLYLARSPAPVRQELQRLRLIASLTSVRVENLPASLLRDPQRWVDQMDNAVNARIVLYSAQGKLLADSRSTSEPALPAFSRLDTGLSDLLPAFRDSTRRQWIYAIRPFGEYRLLVAAPRPRLPVLKILEDEFTGPFTRAAVIALVLALVMAYWIARWIGTPLQRIADTAHAISRTDSVASYQPLVLHGPAEVQELARAFNAMVARVQASQQSQRDFVANVSHDLKTPLTSIQGFSQAMLDGTLISPEDYRSAAQVIFSEAERMHHQVSDLLELARLDAQLVAFDQTPFELSGLLRAVQEKYSPLAAGSGIDLVLDLGDPPAALQVSGDADRLAQVFANLVDNALKFTPAGGQVVINLQQAQGAAQVAVVDTGLGLPAGEQNRIFERFYQGDKSRQSQPRKGVGLGLAIARQVVEAHRGKIVAYNVTRQQLAALGLSNLLLNREEPLHGSIFVVTLPAVHR